MLHNVPSGHNDIITLEFFFRLSGEMSPYDESWSIAIIEFGMMITITDASVCPVYIKCEPLSVFAGDLPELYGINNDHLG